jgi:DNA-binding NarL/FixJ family response regulator
LAESSRAWPVYSDCFAGQSKFEKQEIKMTPTKTPPVPAKRPLGTKTRIYLMDDHPLMVTALTSLINQEKDMKVVGSGADWNVVLAEFPKKQVEVLILDLSLARSNGVEMLKSFKVHFPGLKVLILSMQEETLYALRMIKAGAQGYIMKEAATEKLVSTIRAIGAGEIYLSERMQKRTMFQLVGRRLERTGSPLTDLSDRELEVFGMIGDGMSTRTIAEKLTLSIKTIETHRTHIKEKLNLNNSTELVQHAIHWRSF